MTVGWILETAVDRWHERGSEPGENPLPDSFFCRYCSKEFKDISSREQHELEHPVLNPSLFFRDQLLGSSELRITSVVNAGDLEERNISLLELNGTRLSSVSELIEILNSSNQGHYSLSYANEVQTKKIKINVCIPCENELKEVDTAFHRYIATSDISDSVLMRFTESLENCASVKYYLDGVLSYLYGIRAKEHQSDVTLFEDFDKKFDQAVVTLRNYNTPLSYAIRTVVRFNRNDFRLLKQPSGLGSLDLVFGFFEGNDIMPIPYSANNDSRAFPVDHCTASILQELMPAFFQASLIELEEKLKFIPKRFRSLQDNSKLNYICFRKAMLEKNAEAIKYYRRRLSHDDVFNKITGEL